jgi:uncharacterized protein
MKFLLDTNCWMQLIREREHAKEVGDLIDAAGAANLATSDLALHSVVIAMRRHRMLDKVEAFLHFSGVGTTVALIRTRPVDLVRVAQCCQQHGLDVEDAYQYVAAELNGLRLVSLDTDFDRTPNGRLTPAAALALFRDEQQRQQQGKQNEA